MSCNSSDGWNNCGCVSEESTNKGGMNKCYRQGYAAGFKDGYETGFRDGFWAANGCGSDNGVSGAKGSYDSGCDRY